MEPCRSESIDYAVMEHTPAWPSSPSGAWSDVGSWNAVADMCPPDQDGNRVEGQGMAIKANNTYIHAPHRRVVALGTNDLLIVDTPDAVLVASRTHAERVKAVVAELEPRQARSRLSPQGAPPLGLVRQHERGHASKSSALSSTRPASLSLQKHYHRAEHWIVVKGTAEVTRGKETFLLTENQSTYIPIGTCTACTTRARPAGNDRSSVRQLSGRGRHRSPRRQLRTRGGTDQRGQETSLKVGGLTAPR